MVSVIYSVKRKNVIVKEGIHQIHQFTHVKLDESDHQYLMVIGRDGDYYNPLCKIPKLSCVVVFSDAHDENIANLDKPIKNVQNVHGGVATGDSSSIMDKITRV